MSGIGITPIPFRIFTARTSSWRATTAAANRSATPKRRGDMASGGEIVTDSA
ncbi:MAG: hypothetical protein AB7S26_19810 [Sandaracinaceae bacterium]